jgi:hypothetical protein
MELPYPFGDPAVPPGSLNIHQTWWRSWKKKAHFLHMYG